MCNPMMLLMGAQAGMSMLGQVSQHQQAKAAAKQNAKSALQSARLGYEQTALRREQEREKSSQMAFNTAIDAAKARGTVITSAGEAGVTGVSVDSLLADAYGREGRYTSSLQSNYDNVSSQLDLEARGIQAQAESRIASMPEPSFTDLAIGLAGTAVSGASKMYNYSNPKT